jgi:hypothetical protein
MQGDPTLLYLNQISWASDKMGEICLRCHKPREKEWGTLEKRLVDVHQCEPENIYRRHCHLPEGFV